MFSASIICIFKSAKSSSSLSLPNLTIRTRRNPFARTSSHLVRFIYHVIIGQYEPFTHMKTTTER